MLPRVPSVAKTPTLPVLVFNAAGFIAGSIPIKGISNFFLSLSIHFVVAVLQATIISLHSFFNRNSEFSNEILSFGI